MSQDLKKVFQHTAIYGIGNISVKAIGLILLPLYTKYISAEEYGVFTVIEVFMQVSLTFIGLKLSTGMMRIFSRTNDRNRQKSTVFTVFTSTIFIALAFNILLQPFTNTLSDYFFDTNQYSSYFRIMFIGVGFEVLNQIYFDLIRVKEKAINFIMVNSVKLALILGLNVYFITQLDWGIESIIISQAIGSFSVFVLSLPLIWKESIPKFNKTILKLIGKFTIPLALSALVLAFTSFSDRLFLSKMDNLANTGVYNLAMKVTGVVNMVLIQSFQISYVPLAYKMFDKNGLKSKSSFEIIFKSYTVLLIICCLIFSLFGQDVFYLLSKNQEYWLAATFIPFICLSLIFKGVQFVLSINMHLIKKTRINLFVVITSGIVNLLLNYFLIDRYGITGACTALIATNIYMFGVYQYFTKRELPFKYSYFKMGGALTLAILTYVLFSVLKMDSTWINIGLKLALISVFIGSCFALKILKYSELTKLKDLFKKKSSSF